MKRTPTQALCYNIKAEMARNGHTQEVLATKLGKNQQWLQRRLAGDTEIKVKDLAAIADALNVPVTTLLEQREVKA